MVDEDEFGPNCMCSECCEHGWHGSLVKKKSATSNRIQSLLDSPCVSDWLKISLTTALDRDILNVYRDSKLLYEVLKELKEKELGQ